MTEHALPPPSDVFGIDGVTVGRTVGLLGIFAGSALAGSAMHVLGDQLEVIGVSPPISTWITGTYQLLTIVPDHR